MCTPGLTFYLQVLTELVYLDIRSAHNDNMEATSVLGHTVSWILYKGVISHNGIWTDFLPNQYYIKTGVHLNTTKFLYLVYVTLI